MALPQDVSDFLAAQDAKLRNAFLTYVQNATDDSVVHEIESLISAGRSNDAIDLIISHLDVLAPAANGIFTDAMAFEGKTLISGELKRIRPLLGAQVDQYAPEAAQIAQGMTTSLIVDLSTGQQQVISNEILNGYANRVSPDSIAARIRKVIGLTTKQVGMVDSYRALLEQQSRLALSRTLRDRRFDAAIERAIEGNLPLPVDAIDRMAEAYRQKRITYRAKVIAKDQVSSIASAAREVAMQQIATKAGVPLSSVERTWNTMEDGKVRDAHDPMDGQIRMAGDPYISGAGNRLMRPHDPAADSSETRCCRCWETYRFLIGTA